MTDKKLFGYGKAGKYGRRTVDLRKLRLKLSSHKVLRSRMVIIPERHEHYIKLFHMGLWQTASVTCRKRQFYIDHGKYRLEDIEAE